QKRQQLCKRHLVPRSVQRLQNAPQLFVRNREEFRRKQNGQCTFCVNRQQKVCRTRVSCTPRPIEQPDDRRKNRLEKLPIATLLFNAPLNSRQGVEAHVFAVVLQ